MRTSFTRVLLFFFCPALFSSLVASGQTVTRVDLKIDEPTPTGEKNGAAARRVVWPVTTGVPFPEGRLTDERQCRLVDDLGDEQPLQSRATATWDARRRSIRWLTIDFLAAPGRRYALEFGPKIRRREFPSVIAVHDDPQRLALDVGALQVEFSRRTGPALGAVRVDLDGDGRIAPDEVVACGPADGDHTYVDQHAARFGNARDGGERTVTIESTGPVRACVRVDGWYSSDKSDAVDGRPAAARIVKYRTRYHFFAGLPLVKLIDEFRIVGSTRDSQFHDIALPLELSRSSDPTSRRVAFAVDAPAGDAGAGAGGGGRIAELPWRAATTSISSVQQEYRHYGNLESRAYVVERQASGETVSHEAQRAGPWVQVVDSRAAVTGSLRWFWQQFPKQWEVTGDRLTLHLTSPRAEPLDFAEAGLRKFLGPAGDKYLLDWKGVRAPQNPIENFFYFAGRHALARDGADGLGVNKHHEAWFHFAPAAQADVGRQYGALADRQPLCLASGEWNCSTNVFGPLAARSNDSPKDSPYEAIVDRIFDLERYAQDAFGDYGWWLFGSGPHYSYQWDKATQRHYADPRRFEYHTYQRETQLWWCYLRSGERKFHDWAIPSENHWIDVAVSHAPTRFSTQWRGGREGDASLHWPVGDWSIDSPLHYVRHHDTGEAWLRSASQFWATYHRTLETTTLAYYLTGDERYNDVVDYWRQYWGDLAGVRSDSTDVRPWHREQLWFQPTEPGRPTKTWAKMLRDYAPFQSGSRHQMTLFFNLSTLLEHSWDPRIAQAVREYADEFLDPDHPTGVWRCQDHRGPSHAESPMLAHYWAPALWKYARASADPRMADVLRRYYTAAYHADPYGGDVGVYSNAHIAWAWHFTRDPRHLVAARKELDDLLPNSLPLASPEELGPRIYNPHQPIRSLAAAPRLIGALRDAERAGIAAPMAPPMAPHRTLVALRQTAGRPLRATIWGWDRDARLLDADGRPIGEVVDASTHVSHRQPFDRAPPGFQVFRATLQTPPATPAASAATPANSAWRFLAPSLETGLLELDGVDAVACWAGAPIQGEPNVVWYWRTPAAGSERSPPDGHLTLESAAPTQWLVSRLTSEGGRLQKTPLVAQPVKNRLRVSLAGLDAGTWLAIEPRGAASPWFRLVELPAAERWVYTAPLASGEPPPLPPSLAARYEPSAPDLRETFVPGRFGKALLLTPGRELRIPDEFDDGDGLRRLSDQRQGTIEFWIRRWWDERVAPTSSFAVLSNGPLHASVPQTGPGKLPLGEWTHLAFVWRPVPGDPQRSLVHVYVDGRDFATYRNLDWAGYAPPPTFTATRAWLREFVVRAPPGAVFAIDDLRISNTPRHWDASLEFGHRQTLNPVTFSRPTAPAPFDSSTVLRLPLDGDVLGTTVGERPISATFQREPRP